MSGVNRLQSVGEIVSSNPLLSVIFEKYQIDFCCGGKRSIEEACALAKVDPAVLVAALEGALAVSQGGASAATDWSKATLEALVLNIVNTHHQGLRTDLPRLGAMVDKVAGVHGASHPELATVQRLFGDLRAELSAHMVKEEQILFPAIVRLEREHVAAHGGGWMVNPIRVMEDEHAAVGALLAQLKQVTQGYTPPAEACNTYRVLYDGLQRMETDLHLHIHKENNILFPRAQALEASMLAGATR